MELIIASRNTFKVKEIRLVLEEMLPHVIIRSLHNNTEVFPPSFEHQDFEQNAIDKAVFAAKLLQKPVISDESGLVIPYLGGYMESMKAKVLQDKTTMLPSTKKILERLQEVEEHQRYGFLESAVAFACPVSGLIKSATSRLEGYISPVESGPATFDFTSIFIKYDYGKTVASLPPSVQDRISHRRKSLQKLQSALSTYFKKNM